MDTVDKKFVMAYLNMLNESVSGRSVDVKPNLIDETRLPIGGVVFPNYNQVLMLAGGAGSGKDYQLNYVIGLTGKVFDVDKFKELALDDSQRRSYI